MVTVLIIVLAVVAVAAIALLLKEKGTSASERTRSAVLEQQNLALEADKQRLETEKNTLQAQISEIEMRNQTRQKEEEERFEAIANRVLLANSNAITGAHKQGLSSLLDPMKRDLDAFRETFNVRMASEAAARNSLGERVRELAELNMTVGRETRRLTDALKGNSKLQGDWGEMILANILQNAGLREGYEYHVQESSMSEDGHRLRPDVVINYTDDRKLVIDSKTSMTDYLRMMEAEDEQARRKFGAAHAASVKKHIQELKKKSYQELGGRKNVDFVLMFIPHEGAYLTALDMDHGLWQEAYASRVLLISPTHLMAVVQMVEQMWRKERQNRNAVEIANKAADMLKRFSAFIEDMQRVDKALTSAHTSYENAYKTLTHPSTGLIAKARRLSELGVKLDKNLPEPEE